MTGKAGKGMSDYLGDVIFDVWMQGGDVDRIDRDRVCEHQRSGLLVDEAAAIELARQRRDEVDRDLQTWEAERSSR